METLKTLPKETQCSPGSLWLPGLGLGSRQLQMGSQLAPTQSLPLLVLKTRQDPLRLRQSLWSLLLLAPVQNLGTGSPCACQCLCMHQLLLSWLPGEHKTLLGPKPY